MKRSKDELRKEFKLIREEQINNRGTKNMLILDYLENSKLLKGAKTVGVYCSFKKEVDTYEMIHYLLSSGYAVCVPKMMDDEMEFVRIKSAFELTSINQYGINEPKSINVVSPLSIDVMLVPGLCFDAKKNRVGYGKGYYDRYLSICPNATKIGLAFSEQILSKDEIDASESDIPMDYILTDKGIL